MYNLFYQFPHPKDVEEGVIDRCPRIHVERGEVAFGVGGHGELGGHRTEKNFSKNGGKLLNIFFDIFVFPGILTIPLRPVPFPGPFPQMWIPPRFSARAPSTPASFSSR